MNKSELVSAIAAQAGLSKKDAEKAVVAFMDEVTVDSAVGVGTSVHMKKTIRR